jgi:urease accessory protein
MLGTAAGPLAGDRLALRIEVRAGASLTMRSVAASVALGGAGDDHSELSVEVDVGAGATLRWLPEPTIATGGCHHRARASIRLADGARLVWREELILGRHGEGPGRLASRLDIEADGVPTVRQELRVGAGAPGYRGGAVVGGAEALGVVVVVGPGGRQNAVPPPDASLGAEVAVLALAGGGVMVSAVAPDAPELRRRLDAGLATLG